MHNEVWTALVELDVPVLRAFWARHGASTPQPRDDAEALATAHMARTAAASIPFRSRAYSHAWLLERGLPSSLPDELRPKVERMFPVVHEAVGILCSARTEIGRAILPELRAAMADAVEDCYANGDTDPGLVRRRMVEARARVKRRLLG